MSADTSVESVTIGSYFGYSTATNQPAAANGYTWLKIKDYPDIGGEPDTVEITDLSDRYHRNLKGVQTNDTKAFLMNYIPSVYNTLKSVSGPVWCALAFGDAASGSSYTPKGDMGIFTWKGELAIGLNGKGVNEAREMTLYATPSTEPGFAILT